LASLPAADTLVVGPGSLMKKITIGLNIFKITLGKKLWNTMLKLK